MKISAAAVLIGSGPSLNDIDIRKLAEHPTIAFNRSWLAWPDWEFQPSFHACLDPATMAILGPELPAIVAGHHGTCFFLHESAVVHGVRAADHVKFCRLEPGARLTTSLEVLTDFGNVGATAVQLLHALGFQRILMVGVDGYDTPDAGDTRDANHFRDDYARGRALLTPTLNARYFAVWRIVAAECGRLGISIRNASPRTSLTCFDRIGFEDGVAWLSELKKRGNATGRHRRANP